MCGMAVGRTLQQRESAQLSRLLRPSADCCQLSLCLRAHPPPSTEPQQARLSHSCSEGGTGVALVSLPAPGGDAGEEVVTVAANLQSGL